MFYRHVFGNISGGFRGILHFLGNFAGFRGNTWISRVRDRVKYQKPWFWHLMFFYTHLLLLLQPSVLWHSIVTFNNDAKPPPKWILCEFDLLRIWPWLGGLPHLEKFTWQNLTPAERVTWSGRPGYPTHDQIKIENIWTGRLPHLRGVPHLHVNRPFWP